MTEHTNSGCNCKPNRSIHCAVYSCANHCKSDEYCGLECICVGTHESNPSVDQCTDCQSFRQMQE